MIDIGDTKQGFHVWRGAWKKPVYGIVVEVKGEKVVVGFPLEHLIEECDPATLN